MIKRLLAGLRAGMSYMGARTIGELWERAGFVRVAEAGIREGRPHDVEPMG
ncbi:hypothetical protein B6U99_02410 [Candidatus Geothermarchaeota archaeon ex4572_27]|nr:MAG: hypothetical protein B6U99_02410 [Candidatus Geothermarchaeota archaeon ex4572_27]